MSQRDPLYIGNDNDIYVRELRLASTKAYVNDAEMTVTLKDSDDTNVSGAVALPMTYEPGSNGNYRGVIPGTVVLSEQNAITGATGNYTAVVTGTSPVLRWEIALKAVQRTS